MAVQLSHQGGLQASPGFRLFNSWQLRLELAKHAAAAVEFMHSKNVIHRDLTSYNLLVTDKFEAKVRQRGYHLWHFSLLTGGSHVLALREGRDGAVQNAHEVLRSLTHFCLQVADFNLSRAMKGQMIPSSGVINSPEWAAPERLSGQRTYNGFAADVFR